MKISRNYLTGNTTIKSKNPIELLHYAEQQEANGYEVMKTKDGLDLRTPLFSFGYSIKLKRSLGQLEQRLLGERRK